MDKKKRRSVIKNRRNKNANKTQLINNIIKKIIKHTKTEKENQRKQGLLNY